MRLLMGTSGWLNYKLTLKVKSAKKYPKANELPGRLAQLDRALASGAKGRGFDPRIAHHLVLRHLAGCEV
jgi:hypothetical protein